MVGKPNLFSNSDLDFERESSMADEGGVSGAHMERQLGLHRGTKEAALESGYETPVPSLRPEDAPETSSFTTLISNPKIRLALGLAIGITGTILYLTLRTESSKSLQR